MKKFLTVLLALSVVFTYSFSAVGTVFAGDEYTLDDYSAALSAEKTAQLGYLANAKTQAVNSYTFDEDGFTEIGGVKYMKAALDAAADAVISDVTKTMDTIINAALNGTFPTGTAPTDVVEAVRLAGDTAASKTAMKTELEKKTDVLNKTQAPLTKAFVEGKLAVDYSKYNSTDKAYESDTLTAVQYIEKLVAEARAKIAAADDETTDAAKIAGYVAAYETFKTAFEAVKTLEDEKIEGEETANTVDAAAKAFVTYGIQTEYPLIANVTTATFPMDLSTLVAGDYKAFYKAASGTKKATVFGVEVGNIKAVTKTEAVAINNAMYAAITASEAPVKAYLESKKLTDASSLIAAFPTVLKNAMDAADVYAEVVAYGNKLKGTYYYGIKEYDNDKVDAAVKAAEKLVYADLLDGFDDAEDYIEAATEDSLYAVNFEYQKFMKAIEDAAEKMYSDGTWATTPAVKITYGDNKTADADLVYLKGTYDTEAAEAWEEIAQKAVADLEDAQSYDEIDKIMAQAAEDFGKLLTADNAADVKKARAEYITALGNYKTLKMGLVDDEKYPEATFEAARLQGVDLINEAVTVDGVKAAYEEAKALIDNIKSNDELEAAKEAIEKKIAALPYTAQLTAADKAKVKAVFDEYAEYLDIPGAAAATNEALLFEKYQKVLDLAAAEIADKAKVLKEKLEAVDSYSDSDLEAAVALKGEADALIAEGTALLDEVEAANETGVAAQISFTVSLGDDFDYVENFFEGLESNREIENVCALLAKAAKEDASVEDMQKALDAYNALTDRQKYCVDYYYLQLAKIVEKKLSESDAYIKSLVHGTHVKINSSAAKGYIKISWGQNDNGVVLDGYEVYRSTKKTTGFKKISTFKVQKSKKYTTGLKKGTKYYYYVKGYKMVNGEKVYTHQSITVARTFK